MRIQHIIIAILVSLLSFTLLVGVGKDMLVNYGVPVSNFTQADGRDYNGIIENLSLLDKMDQTTVDANQYAPGGQNASLEDAASISKSSLSFGIKMMGVTLGYPKLFISAMADFFQIPDEVVTVITIILTVIIVFIVSSAIFYNKL